MAARLTPDGILREIAEVWVSLGRQGEGGQGVLRACSMTLVVIAEEGDDFQALGETLAALMPEHPSRAIVIRIHSAARAELAGRAFAQCWMPFGQRRQICCEQIEITASEAALEDAMAAAAAVAAPDLPVMIWSRRLRLLEHPEFPKITALADRVIVDTAGAPDPVAAIRHLAGILARGVRVGDLSWTRLTRWREMLSRAFENRDALGRLPPAVEVRIRFGGDNAPVGARYMGVWIAESLRAAGTAVTMAFEHESSAPAGALQGVELTGTGFRVDLSREETRLRIEVNGLAQCARLPDATDYLLMREELGVVRRDPVFERTLASAAVV